MVRLYVARYEPGPDFTHNPFDSFTNVPEMIELLAIDGDDAQAIVLFESDELTARALAAAGCEVVPASPGRYRDQGSEAVVVVRCDMTYSIEEEDV